jgi:hypothetical protein
MFIFICKACLGDIRDGLDAGRRQFAAVTIRSAADLSCILLRKMVSVGGGGFGAVIGSGMPCCWLAEGDETEGETLPRATTTRTIDRSTKKFMGLL